MQVKNISLSETTVYLRLGEQVRSLSSNQMHYMWLSDVCFQIYAFASSFLLLPLMLWHDCPNPVLTKWSRLKETLWLKVLQFTGIILPRQRVWLAWMLANLSVIVCDGVGSCSLTICFRWSWNSFFSLWLRAFCASLRDYIWLSYAVLLPGIIFLCGA